MFESLKRKIIYLSVANEERRYAWVRQKLKEIPAGSSILDAGAGERPFRDDCQHLNYVSQDFNKYTGTGNGVAFQTGTWNVKGIDIISDITRMPVNDESFDVILCTEVFEHIPNPFLALKEFSRILKSGGILIITAPFASSTHFAPYHYLTGFSRYFYMENLPRAGFTVNEIIPNGDYYSYLVSILGMFPGVLNKYATRKLVKLFILPAAIFIIPLIFLTSITRKFTDKSEEFLCFGYFVVAKKNEHP